jgi:alkylation response protein AidB-like acyl-CoA dehydrogenase
MEVRAMIKQTPGLSPYHPIPVRPDDDRFVGLALELGGEFAPRAAQHDRENRFVAENFQRLLEAGYLRLAVPEELGGLGASLRQVCYAQAELAKHCASTALAVNMHLFLTLALLYRWRKGFAAAEGLLRRVAAEGTVLMTSGGSDWTHPTGSARKVEGGWRVSGRKTFCSQAPLAGVFITSARCEDPQEGTVVLALSIPTNSPGLRVVETWDALGMRGTASHDVELEEVFVPEEGVLGRRPWGRLDPILRNFVLHFSPTASAVYWGVAASARDEALQGVLSRRLGDGRPLAQEALVQRLVGLMEHKLKTAWWALLGALDELGPDYQPDDRAVSLVQAAKRTVVTEAVEVVDLALQAVGGASYFKRSPLERAYRDVRAGEYHPFTPEATLLYLGRLALGQPADGG